MSHTLPVIVKPTIAEIHKLQCPICGSTDKAEFVFSAHYVKNREQMRNPSDYHNLYLCECLNVYDAEGKTVKVVTRPAI